MKNRILSLLLAAVMLVGTVLATGAFASEEETGYPDVPSTRWSAESIIYMTEKGMMQDTGSGKFEPTKTVNRAMVVTVLYRMAGSPAVTGSSAFSDIEEGKWYTDAVIWGSKKQIVTGFSDNTFRPVDSVTREQLVTFIGRYAEMNYVATNGTSLDSFTDSGKIKEYALDYFKWAVNVGLVNGVTDTEIRPTAGATREQFAAIMHRYDTCETFDYELVYNEPTVYSHYTEKDYPLRDDADFFVSTTGSDSNDGKTIATAFATMERAKEAVRDFKKTATDEIVVAFMAGEYGALTTKFTAEDSGTEAVPITYCAYGDGDVTFNNGISIKEDEFEDLEEADKALFKSKNYDSIKKYDLTGLAAPEQLKNGTLFTEDAICEPARYPNKVEITDATLYYACTRIDNRSIQVAGYLNNRIKGYHTLDDVVIVGKLMWEYMIDRVIIEEYDPETGILKLSHTAGYDIAEDDGYGGGKAFFIQNVSEELDYAGEYFIDYNSSTLYVYEPQGTYDFAYMEKNFVTVTDGAQYLTFRGFDFTCTTSREITGDFIFPQYTTWQEISDTAAFSCTAQSSNITVDLCSFSRIDSGYAVFLDGYNMSFTNNEVYTCAGGGIFSYCGDWSYRHELKDYKKLIDNNLIYNTGIIYTTYRHAIYSFDAGAVISHNDIYDVSHFAIEPAGVNTIFEYNVMANCNQRVADGGTIYTAQFYTRVGNEIRYNLFREGSNGYQIYLDNGVSGQRVYGNLFYTDIQEVIILSGGRENDICDNIIIAPTNTETIAIRGWAKYADMARAGDIESSATWAGGKPWTIWPDAGSVGEQIWKEKFPWTYELDYNWRNYENINCSVNSANCTISNNISFGPGENSGKYVIDDNIYEFNGVIENNVHYDISENPIFVNPTLGDYRFREDADTSKIGQLPDCPVELMGRY